jgi:hemerythrin-like domain-containing protein
MLSDIKPDGVPAVEADAVDMLLACHQRIRNFTGIALRLAEAEGAGAQEVSNAAEAVHRYYTVALPLHEEDENRSVYPRLRKALTPETDAFALDLMIEQHGPINEVVDRLVLLWSELRSNPALLPALRPRLRTNTARLVELWNEHLSLEEEIVFPLIRKSLAAAELEAIHREMKQRRGVAGDSQ